MNTVANRKMATVWATSSHLVLLFVRLAGSSKALMHWKKRMMTTPSDRLNKEVKEDRQTHRSAYHRISHR